jgi:nucleotide-binding universal stress UspA family protein
MYTRILIPLDGSDVAAQVLPPARALANNLSIPVELLGVVDPVLLADFAEVWERHQLDKLLADEARSMTDYLDSVARSFAHAQVRSSLEAGSPAAVIVQKAATDKKTLLIMATHGRSGVQRWLLGSVTEKVLHGSSNHLFLVRASADGKTEGEAIFKTVIVPLDGSELAEKALSQAAELAKAMNLHLVLMRAYALPSVVFTDAAGSYADDLIAGIKTEVESYLAGKVSQMRATGIEKVSSIARVGAGAEEIIDVGRATPDNFIMMCTHGRTGFQRWLLGSVTEKVVSHSGDPVLIVQASSSF